MRDRWRDDKYINRLDNGEIRVRDVCLNKLTKGRLAAYYFQQSKIY